MHLFTSNRLREILLNASLILIVAISLHAQSDSTNINRKRTLYSSIGVGAAWTGSMGGLATLWYSDSWGNGFRFFNDGKEWLQMDKVGHAYTGYHLQRNMHNLYQWAGWNQHQSLMISGLISTGYLTTLEIFDGFSDNWGFSWWDMAANVAGVALFTSQELIWGEQYVKLKFSSSPSPYAKYRPEVLGNTYASRLLKDYNGQTYWLSFHPTLKKDNFLPNWINLSVGYSIAEKLHGTKNKFTTTYNNQTQHFHAYRQYFLSFDIDFEAIATNKKWLRTTLQLLNHIKVPFPTLAYYQEQLKFQPIYF